MPSTISVILILGKEPLEMGSLQVLTLSFLPPGIFFCASHTFRWSSTYLCDITFENAKKVENRLTLLRIRIKNGGKGIAQLSVRRENAEKGEARGKV
jgi:hypothetical protein